MKKLFNYLSIYGGRIISTKDLKPHWIEQAKVSDRMYVDEDSFGYVWEPYFDNDIPTTADQIEIFEKWYPLPTPMPTVLENPGFLFKKIINTRSN